MNSQKVFRWRDQDLKGCRSWGPFTASAVIGGCDVPSEYNTNDIFSGFTSELRPAEACAVVTAKLGYKMVAGIGLNRP